MVCFFSPPLAEVMNWLHWHSSSLCCRRARVVRPGGSSDKLGADEGGHPTPAGGRAVGSEK